MRPARTFVVLAACAAWLTLSASYAAPATAAEPAVDLGGQELPSEGSRTDRGNPVVVTAGLWADTLGADPHHFRYQRQMKDSTVHVGVVGTSTVPAEGDGVGLAVSTAQTDCGSDEDSVNISAGQAAFGAQITVDSDDPSVRDSPCFGAEIDIEVNRGYSSTTADLPIALKIVEEAPVAATGDLPPVPDEDTPAGPTTVEPTEDLDGAASFDDAPLLEADPDGVGVSTTLTEGDVRLWRVPVTWGRQVSAVASVAAMDQAMVDAGISGPEVDIRLVDPLRNSFAPTVDDAFSSTTFAAEPGEASVGTVPLRYLNRFTSGAVPTVPGDLWVEVTVEHAPEDRDPIDVPVDLTVAVTGEDAGAPSYPGVVVSPDGSSEPEGYSADTPFLVGEGRFAAVASGNPAVSAASEGEDWWGARRAAGLGLAAVSVASLAAGAWLLRARRRTA